MSPRFVPHWSLLACLALLGVVAWTTPARAEGRAHAAAIPAWVDKSPPDPRSGDVHVSADDGVVCLLSDRQIKVTSVPEHYERRAFRVEAPTGIESVSELHFDFDPTFEKLSLHFVRILRGGKVIDALKHADWKVIQPESDLDRRIYSGDLEGLLFLHDVRVGDVIDYAFTVRGANPVLGGRFAERMFLTEGSDVGDFRRRIVTDPARPLRVQVHGEGSTAVESADERSHEYTWRRANVVAEEDEDEVPEWYTSGGWVDISDFASWNEVATAAAGLFAAREDTSPEMIAKLAEWRSTLPTEEDRVLAATQFVQDEIRYLGIEIGPHSHQPFPPATVLQRRFGDCKDKSLLLVTLLRNLGVTAGPALVSTDYRRTLDERLPSPFVFDHAIVRAVVDGKPYFLDPTVSLQRGRLAGREPPPFERALLVSRDTQELVPIDLPRPKVPTYEADETYAFSPGGAGPVQLDVVTTFRGGEADDMRAKVASKPASEIGRDYLNYYARTYPEIRSVADPVFEDDAASDTLVVHERYEVPGFWHDGERELSASLLDGYLTPPRVSRRHLPLAVGYPERVAQHIHVKMESAPELPEAVDLKDDAVRFRSRGSYAKGTLTLDYEYEALADSVPAAQVAAHLALLERMGNAGAYTILAEPSAPAKPTAPPPKRTNPFWPFVMGLGGGVLVIFLIVAAAKIARAVLTGNRTGNRRDAYRKLGALAEGEAPTLPIPVGGQAEIDAQVARSRCAGKGCSGRLARANGGEAPAEMRLGERTVFAVPAACGSCGEARRVYFEMR